MESALNEIEQRRELEAQTVRLYVEAMTELWGYELSVQIAANKTGRSLFAARRDIDRYRREHGEPQLC